MKKLMSFAVVALLGTSLFTSCSTGDFASIYAGYTQPVAATSNPVGKKVGTSSRSNILGWITTGDGGIDKAAKEGGIKKISHVDQKTTSVLCLFTNKKTVVYGE